MAKAKKLNFDSAYAELLDIQSKIQDENVSVEEISKMIKRSTELIKFCKDRLRGIETDIDKAFADE